MKAVLMVAHGSRDQEANDQVRRVIHNLNHSLDPALLLELCFLELEAPGIDQGIANCVAKGAEEIALIPIMLLQASHSKIHIPNAIDQAKKKYPNIHFSYGRPIGIHPAALEICQTRLEECGEELRNPDPKAAVLVVGRGGSDPDANSDLYKISRLLWEQLDYKWVETAFFAVTDPSVEEGINRLIKLEAKKIIILPYFLFTGVLIKELERMVEQLKIKYPDCQFKLAGFFGFHPNLEVILKDRINEALKEDVRMNCDTCQYRFEASKHTGHHHHHHEPGHHHDHVHHHDHHHDHCQHGESQHHDGHNSQKDICGNR